MENQSSLKTFLFNSLLQMYGKKNIVLEFLDLKNRLRNECNSIIGRDQFNYQNKTNFAKMTLDLNQNILK